MLSHEISGLLMPILDPSIATVYVVRSDTFVYFILYILGDPIHTS